jgi:hypothetical protein
MYSLGMLLSTSQSLSTNAHLHFEEFGMICLHVLLEVNLDLYFVYIEEKKHLVVLNISACQIKDGA